VVVLSTNLRRNLDSAFARRLEFIVPFDPPDAAARERLWKLHAPKWARLSADVRLADLAALYDLSGALIRNAATAAGYLAAGDRLADDVAGPPTITPDHLARALEREHAKAGMAYPGAPPALHTVNSRAIRGQGRAGHV
jgi:SpoVK/Ycf46/Vps4 family AAA+-type ATPase